jgi:hypothetical protein
MVDDIYQDFVVIVYNFIRGEARKEYPWHR